MMLSTLIRIARGLLRDLLERLVHKHGWAVRLREGRRFYGLEKIDEKLIEIIKPGRRGWYVELGANDGVTQSNTLHLELYYGWRGVLIEPMSRIFSELVRRRNGARNEFRQALAVSPADAGKAVEIIDANLMSIICNLDGDIGEPVKHAAKGRELQPFVDWEANARSTEVLEAETLDQILSSTKIPTSPDLLVLDVEGHELSVLQGANLSRWKFRWILVEARNFRKIEVFLNGQNYKLVQKLSHHDYLFQLQDVSSP